MKINKFGLVLLFASLFTGSFAQDKTKSPEKQPVCDAEFTTLLVDQQVAGGKNASETDKRIKILIGSADFLWQINEEKSRTYLADAFDLAEDRFNALGFERRKIGTYKSGVISAGEPDYRFEVIREIAKKDSLWANKLIKKVMKDFEKDFENRKDSLYQIAEIASLMGMAGESMKNNPEHSLSLYRMAMRHPLDRHWFWQLYSMWQTDANLTNRIYNEALNAYSSQMPSKLLFLSAYPFGSSRFFGADRFSFPIRVPPDYVPQRDLQIRFLNTFLSRTESLLNDPGELGNTGENGKLAEIAYVVSALNELEPFVSRDLPEIATRFSQVKIKANVSMNETVKKNLEEKEDEYKKSLKSFAEKLKMVEEAFEKGTLRDQDVIDLVLFAKTEEDFKLAEPWIYKIKDNNARAETLSYFFYQRAGLALKENRLEDAEIFTRKISNIAQKAIVALKIGQARIKTGKDKYQVESILTEVSALAEKMETSNEKAQILLALVSAYEDVNHFYALEELGKAVKVINKLENPDVTSGFINHKVSGDGYEFFYYLLIPGDFNGTFEKMSKNDFQLSLVHAQSLDDEYLKTLAVLTTAKNCAEKNKKTANVKNNL